MDYTQVPIQNYVFDTQSGRAATCAVCAAFATALLTRPQIEALPEPHFTDPFCSQMQAGDDV